MFQRRRKLAWSQLKVGLIVTLTLLIVFAVVFFSGAIEAILVPKSQIKVFVKDVKGLRDGAPVRLQGVEIGSVKSIKLSRDGTIITLTVRRNALRFIRRDAHAAILTFGLLGDKYIELSMGTPEAPPMQPGAVITGTAQPEFTDLVEASAGSIRKVTEFVARLDAFVAMIETSEGTLAKLVQDPTLYKNLTETATRLSRLVGRMERAEGTLALLLEDPTLYRRTVEMTSYLEEFARRLAYDPGTLQKLVEDPSLYNNLNQSARELATILQDVEQGRGTVGSLVTDKEIVRELRVTIEEIRSLVADIKKNPRKYLNFELF